MNSIKEITLAMDSSKTVLWNGPLGYFEDARFRDGSDEVAQIVATYTKAGKLQSIAGGGDTLALLESNGLIKEFSYVSTAGGAFLEWLENGDLPGIAALRN
jgi:phosphoglycerate kinase